jgi:hypothetical protein
MIKLGIRPSDNLLKIQLALTMAHGVTNKLCKNDYEILAKKSHLIPKFLYKNIIKNKDKPIDKFIYKVKEKKVFDPKKISPDGYFENDIFCINCEKIFKYLEDYFSSVVFNKVKNKLTPFREEIFRNNLRCIKFTNFDNKKFKLFLLSILWRLSVSKKIEFVGLNLGRYEDEIGSLIQKNLESESFGYLSINTFDNFNWLKDIIFLPSQQKNNIYGSYYKMVFGPYIFLVNISIKNLDELFNENSGSVNYLYDLPNNITQEDFLSDSFLFRFKNSIELKF